MITVLAGCPRDSTWPDVARQAQLLLDAARDDFILHEEHVEHRRGSYGSIAVGMSYGGGQTVSIAMPSFAYRADPLLPQYVRNFAMGQHNQAVADRLLCSSPIRRLANFASSTSCAYSSTLCSLPVCSGSAVIRSSAPWALQANPE